VRFLNNVRREVASLPKLLPKRYIRLWIFRHRHLATERLITTLAIARYRT
jgi:hypothetical protein